MSALAVLALSPALGWGENGRGVYDFDTIAETGQIYSGLASQPTSFATPSINDLGKVAFICNNGAGGTLCAGGVGIQPTGRAARIEFSSRLFQQGIQINNAGVIAATDRASGPVFLLQTWDSQVGNFLSDIADGRFLPITDFTYFTYDFDAVFGFASFNNEGESAFIAQGRHATFGSCREAACLITPGFLTTWNELPIVSPARPRLADNGSIVVRYQNTSLTPPIQAIGPRSIRVYTYDLSSFQEIPQTASFFSLGLSPAISDDGSVVIFTGERSQGAPSAVFMSMDTGAGFSAPIQLTGRTTAAGANVAELGFGDGGPGDRRYIQSVDLSHAPSVLRVDMGDAGPLDDYLIVTFAGQANGPSRSNPEAPPVGPPVGGPLFFSERLGLWSVRIDLARKRSGSGPFDLQINSPIPVVQVGDSVPVNGNPKVVTGFSVHDSLAAATTDVRTNAVRTQRRGDHRIALGISDLFACDALKCGSG